MDYRGKSVLNFQADQKDEEITREIVELFSKRKLTIDRAYRVLEDARSILPLIAKLPPV